MKLVSPTLILLLLWAPTNAEEAPKLWAIALHGGASRLPDDMSEELRDDYRRVLETSLAVGVKVLSDGGSALDAAERTVMALEDCPLFNAGRGSVFDESGGHAMDASIMDGSTLACGGVAGVRTLRNPIQGARIVMEKTPHVLMSGPGADRLAARHGATLAPPSYFSVPLRFEKLQAKMRDEGREPPETPLYGWSATDRASDRSEGAAEVGGTVGCVALDSSGRLVAATSTGGRNAKLVGRIGDSPIPGAGNYANGSVAVGGTGAGEEYLRHLVTGRVAMLVESGTHDVDAACRYVLEEVLQPGDGGLIAVDRRGKISMRATTGSMPSAAADSSGLHEIKIDYE